MFLDELVVGNLAYESLLAVNSVPGQLDIMPLCTRVFPSLEVQA